jgi:hypothetical protein
MTQQMPPSKPTKTPSAKPTTTIGNAALQAFGGALVGVAFQQTGKLVKSMADRRKHPRLRYVAIYHNIDKVRNIGEKALTLDDKGAADQRQRMAAQSAALCDALHEQLAALRLSPATQKAGMLDTAARTAIKDADSLAAALNKWAMNTSGASQTRTLQQAVLAIDASEDTLVSFLGKAPRRRPWERKNQRSSDDKPI